MHPFGIKGLNLGPQGLQGRDDVQGGGVAHIISVGLEGQAQYADRLARDRAAQRLDDPACHGLFARIIHLDGGLHEGHRRARIDGGAHQGQRIFRKARSAIAGSGMEELGPDPAIQPNALGHLLHIRADRFA